MAFSLPNWLRNSRARFDELRALVGIVARTRDDGNSGGTDVSRLEARVLLSATPLAVAAESADVSDGAEVGEDQFDDSLAAEATTTPANVATGTDPTIEPVAIPIEDFDTLLADLGGTASLENSTIRQELVFVDPSADGFEELLAGLRDAESVEFEVVVLNSRHDGIEQISATLAQREGVNAIHLVSHGSAGSVKLGNTWLTSDSLGYYGELLTGWQNSLAEDADLLIYGCDLAADAEGQELVNALSVLTGADAAASEDDTGHASLGGDWHLEYTVGVLETDLAFSIDVQQSWTHLLATSETHYFLRGNGIPEASLDQSIPTSTTMQDYDNSRHGPVGTMLQKGGSGFGESDPVKHQRWTTASGSIDIDGPVTLTIWSAMKDMNNSKGGTIHAYLIDIKGNGTDAQLIASDTITRGTWSSSGDWVEDTFDFGNITRSLAANRRLQVKVVVDGSSDDDVLFAYDDVHHRSHLRVGMTTSNGDPVLTMGGSPLDYNEGDGAKEVDGGISLTDDAPDTQQWATVRITGGFQAGEDVLSYTDSLFGTTMNYDAATGEMVFYGAASTSDYQDILGKVRYQNTSEDPDETSRTVTFTVYDGENLSTGTQTINVTGINDDPTVNPTAADTGLEDQNIVYTHAQMLSLIGADDVDNNNAELTVNISGTNNASFSKSGSGNGTTYTFTLTQPQHTAGYDVTFSYEVADLDLSTASGGPATITILPVNDEPILTIGSDENVDEDTGFHSVAGFASASPGGGADESGQTFTYNVSHNNGALFSTGPAIDSSGNLTYTLAPDAFGTAVVTVSVTDSGGTANGGDNQSPSQQFNINVANANNDDAYVAANNGMTLNEGFTQTITSALLRAEDVDFPASSTLVFSVTTSPLLGQLELTTAPMVAITTFTQDDIDNNRLVYAHGGAEAPLTDSFEFSVTDGIGSPTAPQTFNITINSWNDAPVNSIPGPQSTPQDTALSFDASNGNLVSISDDDAGGANVEVTLTVTNGTLTLGLPEFPATSVGGETPVNTTLGQTQSEAVVAVRNNGEYVVAWSGKGSGGESAGVWIQLYDANGNADLAGNIRVNTETADVQSDPTIAMDNNGNFVVVWTSNLQDGDKYGIFGQRFDSSGNPLGTEFQVNTTWSKDQQFASVAMDANGDFVVVWEDKEADGQNEGIFGQRFDSLGVAQGTEFQVNTNWSGKQAQPKVAMDAAGNFVVAWSDSWKDGHNNGVFAQRFDKDGNTLGGEFQVNTEWDKDQIAGDVAMNAAGEFVIVWTSDKQDTAGSQGIYGQRYDAAGNTVGGEFLINSTVANDQQNPSVSMSATGGFAVTWESVNQDNPGELDGGGFPRIRGVYAQQFDSDGNPLGGETLINTTTIGHQNAPHVDMNAGGDFIIVWDGNGVGDDQGVFHQRFDRPNPPLTFSIGDGASDTMMTFTGTLADINSALDGMMFLPDPGFTGVATIDIDVNDQGNSGAGPAGLDSDTITINVTSLNTPPTITAIGNQTIAEDSSTGALAFTVGDAETAAGSLTVTASSSNTTVIPNGNLSLVDLGGGNWTIEAIPAANQNGGPVTITVTVDDGTTTTDITFDVTITPVNDAPTISAIADQTISEDTSTGALAFSVGDVETASGSLTVTASSSNTTLIPNSNLTLIDLGSGNWTIEGTPAANLSGGPVTITVTVDDGTTTTDATFNVTVTAVNDAPTATAIADQTISEDSSTGALAFTVSDVETAAGSLTVTASSSNTTLIPNGNLTLIDLGGGNWTIEATPAANQNGGPVTITVTVDDGTTTTNETFDVTVTAVNDDPTISAIANQTINEDTSTGALAFTVGDVETAAGSLTVTASSSNTTVIPNGNLTLVDLGSGNWTIEATPATNQNGGPVTVTVTVDDGTTTTDETFDVTVTAVNDAPTVTAIADQTISEDSSTGALAFTVGDVETPVGSLTVTASSSNTTLIPNGNLTLVDLGGGNWTIAATPIANLSGGPVTITVTVDDGTTTTDETFDVTVTAVNDAPTVTAIANQTIVEDSSTGALAFTVGDVETPAGSLTVTASSSNMTIIPNGNLSLVDLGGGNWTIEATPAANQNGGPVTITVTVDDGTTTTDETFDVTVTAVNDAPTVTAIANQSINEDTSTGALAFTVGDAETAVGSLTVTASSSNTTLIPNGNLTLIDLGSGNWTIEATPAANLSGGPVTITVTVDDGTTTTDATFNVTVTAVNDAPTATAIADQTISEDSSTGALAFTVSDVETAAGSLTVTASSSNTTLIPNGNLTLIDLGGGNWTIEATPAANQNGGPVTITVTVDDGTTTTNETFDVTVTAVNDDPTISAIANQTINEDTSTGALAFTVGDVETAAGSLTVTASSSNTTLIPNGNLTLVDLGSGNWTIEATPATNQNGGPVTVTVTVDDGTTTTDTTFDVTVTAVNDAPTVSAIANQTINEDTSTGALAFTVGDVESAAGSLTVMASSSSTTLIPNGNLTLVDLGGGNWTIEATPALNLSGGPVTITVTVDDGTTTTDTTFDVTVTADNDAPTITAIGNQTITEDTSTGALAFTVSDVESAAGSLTVTASSSSTTLIPNGNLTLVDLGGGSWTIEATPALNQNGGPVTITVTVDDGTTTTDTMFDVTITPDNDAPTVSAITDQIILENTSTGALGFTVGDVETPAGSLLVTAISSNATLIPNGNLTLVDLGGGNWTIEATPAVNQIGGPVTITVTVDDGTVTTDVTFDVTIIPLNDAPTITPIGDQIIAEDGSTGSLAFTVADTESPVGLLIVTASSSDTSLIPNGNLTLVNLGGGNWTIEASPALDQNGGPVTITVTVDDGITSTDTTFDVTITSMNDDPTISAIGDQTIAEDTTTGALAFTIGDVETPVGSLTVTATSSDTVLIPNANLTLVDLGGGNWTIEATPALNQNGGPVTITVTVDDGTTTIDTAFDVTVTADNDAPTISAIADQTIAEDTSTGALAFGVADVETPLSSLSVTASSSNTTLIPNGNLTLVDLGSGNWTIEATPAPNANGGPVTITVTVDDGTTTTDTTFDVTVTADNDLPVITTISDRVIIEDTSTGPLAFTVSDVETPVGSLTVTASSNNTVVIPNANLTLVDLGSGNWTVEATPALNQNGGPVTITVTVGDGTTTTDTTFDVTVTADNDLPTITTISDRVIVEDTSTGPLAFTISDVETPVGSLTVTASSNNTTVIPNANLTLVDLGSGNWTIEATPALNANGGPVTITLTVSDGTANVTTTFDVTVTPDNDLPTITAISDQTIAEDGSTGPLVFTVGDVETPLGSLVVTASSANTTLIPNGSLSLVNLGSGNWTIEAAGAPNQNGGPVTVTVSVGDGTAVISETFDVRIDPVNDDPTATPVADQTIDQDTTTGALTFSVSDVESGGGALVVTASSSDPALIPGGNLVLVNLGGGNWTIEATPAAGAHGGPVTITLLISDGTDTTIQTFEVTVLEPTVAPPPIVVSDPDPDPVPVPDPVDESPGADAAPDVTGSSPPSGISSGVGGSETRSSVPDFIAEIPEREDLEWGVNRTIELDDPNSRLSLIEINPTTSSMSDELQAAVQSAVEVVVNSPFELLMQNASFWDELDSRQQEYEQSSASTMLLVGSSGVLASGFSVGYVVWLLRGSALISGILAQMPAWRLMDPLVVLQYAGADEEDDESLGDIVDNRLDDADAKLESAETS